MFRTRSGCPGLPRRLVELHGGAEWLRGIVLPHLAYVELSLARKQLNNLREVVVAIVGGMLALRWRAST
jgi:hypothetical protein